MNVSGLIGPIARNNSFGLFTGFSIPGRRGVYRYNLKDGTPTKEFSVHDGTESETHVVISPDDQWLAYASDRPGGFEIYVGAQGGAADIYQITFDGGWAPRWSPNGKTIYYRKGQDVMAVDLELSPGEPPEVGSPRQFFSGSYSEDSIWTHNYDLHPDGDRFLMIKEPLGSRQLLRFYDSTDPAA